VPTAVSPALAVEDLRVTRGGRPVLTGLTLQARRGELTAVLGPNGAGKTTLIRCCTGLVRPDGGRVLVLGTPPGNRETAAKVGLMPQSTGAWSGIRAGELLRYLAGLYATPQDLDLLIGELRLEPLLRTPYRRLSGGQQQSVNLAAALVGRPEVVVLDEPTAGMDPHARRATWSLLERLRAAGVTLVLTTHTMEEAEALADQVFILDRGRVAVEGTVSELTGTGQSLESVFLTHTSLQAPA
jgi:ABC-2 type transport system ATP-binding protein